MSTGHRPLSPAQDRPSSRRRSPRRSSPAPARHATPRHSTPRDLCGRHNLFHSSIIARRSGDLRVSLARSARSAPSPLYMTTSKSNSVRLFRSAQCCSARRMRNAHTARTNGRSISEITPHRDTNRSPGPAREPTTWCSAGPAGSHTTRTATRPFILKLNQPHRKTKLTI